MSIRVDKADWNVLREYGRAMLSVQLFELSIKGLAQLALDVDEDASFDEVWRETKRKVFLRPAGPLVRDLGLDEDLAREVRDAVGLRNELAHDYLLSYRIARAAGDVGWTSQIPYLRRVARGFESSTARLEELGARAQRARGWDPNALPVSVRDLRRLLRESR